MQDRIANDFMYHRPFGDQPERYNALRHQAGELARAYARLCPVSRELSLAMTNLEQSVMWANAAIARNEKESPGACPAD